ncbi:carcinoembryonic antigen-related cell adhesion molecule 1-like isoform X1 [Callorhinchus milii]|uniref:carcinoembryonic antigen-related cell adhesion molecule 1-like isoform X1 n=1 Tax=Callorhinchus milii TaxID=7868 RepID=UPI001C3F61C2|nr:carcinoembryonic antigen-related cell adhesion molecule 1-like isoform X1 [Callorhinchus milii]
MQTARLGVVALCCCVCVVTAQFTITVPDNPITAAAGGTAVFTVKPSGEVGSGSWSFDGRNVLLWVGDSVSVNSNYQGRAELSLPDVSLRLKSVTVTDRGNYTVTLTSVSGDSKSATVTLKVEEKITSVTVTQNIPNPIEYTDNVTLTCDVKGTVESRLWFKDERALHSNDRITISQDNATLTIISVTRNDGGTYRCEAKNSFSSQSGSYTLSIAYSVGAQDQSATIAAITLGVILFVIIILLIAVVVYRQCGHSAGDPGISSTRNEARTIYQNESIHMGNQDNEVPDRPYERIGPQSSEYSNLTVAAPKVYENINNVQRAKNKELAEASDPNATYTTLQPHDQSLYSDLRGKMVG